MVIRCLTAVLNQMLFERNTGLLGEFIGFIDITSDEFAVLFGLQALVQQSESAGMVGFRQRADTAQAGLGFTGWDS
jgi:hypothetical protein